MSTAMIRAAPARRAPAIAAHPTPPHPMTATDWPRRTPPVLSAAPSPAITPQPSRPATAGATARSTFVHWPECTSVFSTNAPMPRAGFSGVPSVRVISLRGVERGEAVPRLAAQARSTVPAHRSPVQHHEITRRDVDDVVANRLDDAARLVTEQERKVVADAALAIVQVGVADAAGLHPDECLTRSGSGTITVSVRTGSTLSGADHAQHLLAHGVDHADRPGAPQCEVGCGDKLPRAACYELDRLGADQGIDRVTVRAIDRPPYAVSTHNSKRSAGRPNVGHHVLGPEQHLRLLRAAGAIGQVRQIVADDQQHTTRRNRLDGPSRDDSPRLLGHLHVSDDHDVEGKRRRVIVNEIRLDPGDPLGRDMCGLRLLSTSIKGHFREVDRRDGESSGREPQRVTSLPRALDREPGRPARPRARPPPNDSVRPTTAATSLRTGRSIPWRPPVTLNQGVTNSAQVHH